MTTHELAAAMQKIARLLKMGPDLDVRDLRNLSDLVGINAINSKIAHVKRQTKFPEPELDSASVALNVSTLAALSRLTKTQWRELIGTWGLPIDVPATYSARDTIGKLLRYLKKHPQAMDKIRKHSETKASPELMRALAVIMGSKSS